MVMAGGAGRREEVASPEDTVYWGWVVLVSTWIAVVTGVGSVTGVWEWAWGGGEGREEWTESIGTEGQFPIPGYYPAMCILTGIMAWVWVTVAWVGMKYFKHAKIQG
ncbi:hypothetical protein EDC01DRAFT_677949 [Geopyxis carbonaria]|nr:hypothetical protein EDC01DRAFT_677949 [Geopyxis carbonaria]